MIEQNVLIPKPGGASESPQIRLKSVSSCSLKFFGTERWSGTCSLNYYQRATIMALGRTSQKMSLVVSLIMSLVGST